MVYLAIVLGADDVLFGEGSRVKDGLGPLLTRLEIIFTISIRRILKINLLLNMVAHTLNLSVQEDF